MNTDTIILVFWIITAAVTASLEVVFIKKYDESNYYNNFTLSFIRKRTRIS